MSAATLVTVTCPEEGCAWSFTGKEPDARWQLQVHASTFDHDAPPHGVDDPGGSPSDPEPEPVGNGKSMTQLANEERQAANASLITVRCADCLWETQGPAIEARREWAEHRRDEHDDETALASVERMARTLGKRDLRRMTLAPQTRKEPTVANGRTAKWTREACIEAIRAFHAEHGRTPRQFELRAPLPASSTLTNLFGSMGEAVRAAGFEPRPKGGAQPREATLRALRHEHELTIRRLEELTGIHRGRLSELERGLRWPRSRELAALEHVYGVALQVAWRIVVDEEAGA